MTLSELAFSGVQAALSGRTVQYDRLPEHGGSDHIPRNHGTVKEIVLDENGKIHLQVKLSVSLGQEARFWAPLCEWRLITGVISDERS